MPLEASTSLVWKYFGFPSKDGQIIEQDKKKRSKVHCKLCSNIIKHSGNTSNSHLKEHHNSVFLSLPKSMSTTRQRKHDSLSSRKSDIN